MCPRKKCELIAVFVANAPTQTSAFVIESDTFAFMAETHVIIALNRKYAELLGEVMRLQHEARKLRKSTMHVEATIRLFRADYDVSEINPVIPYKAVRWRIKGQGIRFAIEALRDAKRPMTTQELAI